MVSHKKYKHEKLSSCLLWVYFIGNSLFFFIEDVSSENIANMSLKILKRLVGKFRQQFCGNVFELYITIYKGRIRKISLSHSGNHFLYPAANSDFLRKRKMQFMQKFFLLHSENLRLHLSAI